MEDGLLTLRAGTDLVHEIEIKRSRFIAHLARTDSPEEARAFIDLVKAEHPQARHNCTAYLIHEDGHSPHQHSSDDGEPAGTAGIPILEALRASHTWNVSAVVTRYFGGVLLGAGGLARAYSSATSQALPLAPKARLLTLDVLQTHLPLTDAGRIEAELRGGGAQILDVTWDQVATLQVGVHKGQDLELRDLLARLTQGRSTFHHVGSTRVEVDVPGPRS